MELELPVPRTWGGKRKNAGRKPTRKGSWIKHRPRPWHDANQPVHVTLKVKRGVPSLRGHKLAGAIGAGLRRAATASWTRQKARRRTFRVVHFSIQPNHVHLIVEATSKTALARGVQGLASGLARRVNNKLGRRGSLFADRYHGRALATPTEVRNAIVYVYTYSSDCTIAYGRWSADHLSRTPLLRGDTARVAGFRRRWRPVGSRAPRRLPACDPDRLDEPAA